MVEWRLTSSTLALWQSSIILTLIELSSVFAIKVRTQFITREDAEALLRQFREDILAKKIEVFAIRERGFALAERLIEQYAFGRRLRTLDAVQIAVALGRWQPARRLAIGGQSLLSPYSLCSRPAWRRK